MANGDDPFDVAAYRTRQGVKPEGGRREGIATMLAGQYLPHVLRGLASLPERAMQAAGSLQYGGSYDPGPALESAGLVMGGTSFGAPRGALGSGFTPPPKPGLTQAEINRISDYVTEVQSPLKVTQPYMGPDIYEQLPSGAPFGVPERAKSLGFNVPAVHGTRRFPAELFPSRPAYNAQRLEQDFGSFNLPEREIGIHFGSPRAAQDILGFDIGYGAPRKFPVNLRVQNPLEMKDLGSWGVSRISQELDRLGFDKKEVAAAAGEGIQGLRNLIQSKGYDSIKYVNKVEDPGHTSYIALNPNQVRVPWAEFDPAKVSSANILSGVAAGGVTGLGALNSLLGPPRGGE